MNLIINLDHDDWILSNPHATLASVGAVNETEYSLFNRGEYERFKANPEVRPEPVSVCTCARDRSCLFEFI